MSASRPDIVLVHSSDLHVDDDPSEPGYGDDGTSGLRWVLDTARDVNADLVLLVGDTFDNNRQSAAILQRATQLLAAAGRPVVILPGNHDPLTPDSVYRRSGMADLPQVHVIGLTHEIAVGFPEHDLEIWGHAHLHYDDMVPLRSPRARAARWHIALAHGHYEADGVPPLRPSWLISDAQIAATGADYLALGHWNRAAQVGNGAVAAYYSGSPDLAGTVNVVRLSERDGVAVTREKLRR
ncbi:MAG TPA: metallophosphoesterase [Acetobacteraceae bacterium]|nr:metallophosphoesterase [Acetobacteraceae bacterium]